MVVTLLNEKLTVSLESVLSIVEEYLAQVNHGISWLEQNHADAIVPSELRSKPLPEEHWHTFEAKLLGEKNPSIFIFGRWKRKDPSLGAGLGPIWIGIVSVRHLVDERDSITSRVQVTCMRVEDDPLWLFISLTYHLLAEVDGPQRALAWGKQVGLGDGEIRRDAALAIARRWGDSAYGPAKELPSDDHPPMGLKVTPSDPESSAKLLDAETMRKHFRDYSPERAQEILQALPNAYADHERDGGRWGPGKIKPHVTISAVTIGRYLKAFHAVGVHVYKGIKIP